VSASTRILVSSSPWSLGRFIPSVFAELAARGAELIFAAEPGKDPVPKELASEARSCAVELPLEREGPEGEAVKLLRRLSDLNRFHDAELAHVFWARRRTALRALVTAGHPDADAVAGLLAQAQLPAQMHGRLTKVLNGLEQLLPPPPELIEAVAGLDVDSVLLVSRCSLGGAERDVLKVARTLGLPTTMLDWSWDNLSSKALLNEQPDHLLVWNDRQVDEAVRLHRFPRERVHACGAPNFDRFFDELGKLEGRAQAERDQKTILYLGSSKNVCRDEPEVFLRWVAAVRAAEDDAVRNARIVVRPYPGGGGWRRWEPAPTADFVVEPARKHQPARLAELLVDADAVVALNTSAELEASLAGRPVVTFRAGSLAPGQEGSVHFEYLLEEHGGFVIDSWNLDEHVRNLSRALRGDVDRKRLPAFAERFVRPAGLARPVSPLVAATVLELAGAGISAEPQLAAR
jgi:hypothetical protein